MIDVTCLPILKLFFSADTQPLQQFCLKQWFSTDGPCSSRRPWSLFQWAMELGINQNESILANRKYNVDYIAKYGFTSFSDRVEEKDHASFAIVFWVMNREDHRHCKIIWKRIIPTLVDEEHSTVRSNKRKVCALVLQYASLWFSMFQYVAACSNLDDHLISN